ncbi:hypothetical protein LNP04_15850 [Chryseobacterium sp. C-71]|uniref:hypothetical protein n=1 Tax=Chryseobacterium sp. C-71 TaxID=2893882 RepID=UPI001E62D853|nr:hypothetical protein [Chryseobacterium sp. C-71]UFH31427.1 hypothetical protein LNP04_15850 [Chryseobacterium sp. C-71]
MISALSFANEVNSNVNSIDTSTSIQNTIAVSDVKIDKATDDVLSICTITITETNHFGMVINQWQKSYYVADWDFAGCKAIGDLRVAQLNSQL